MSRGAPRSHSSSDPPGARRGRLPDPVSSFIGRAAEVNELVAVAALPGLVTLVGAPGVGKTRLALEVARASARSSRPVAWVDLAPLRRAEAVPEAVAGAVGVLEEPKLDMTSQVVNSLATRSVLLVLDNCEHLVGACAELAGAVIQSCPDVTVLATSRQPLGVDGEHRCAVAPMSGTDGAELFYARAAASDVGFDVSDESAAAVTEICVQLDGIPLAIELAAGRIGVLSPVEIAARLAEDPLGLLAGGALDDEGRHKCLRVALDWSYGLLSLPEKALLRRLAVFSGGATVEAAQQVCPGGRLVERRVPELLEVLVAKSLVVRRGDGEDARYLLLETIRLYAGERMGERRETAQVSARHAQWCVELAERVGPELTGADQLGALATIDAEYDNLAAAFAWSMEPVNDAFIGLDRQADSARKSAGTLIDLDPQAAMADIHPRIGATSDNPLRLAAPLTVWWRIRGRFTEGGRWLEEALVRCPDGDRLLRAQALWGAAFMAHMLEADRFGETRLRAALRSAQSLGSVGLEARSLLLLANMQIAVPAQALSTFRRAAALARKGGDQWCEAHALALAGNCSARRHDAPKARRLLRRAVALARRASDLQGLRIGLHMLGWFEMDQGYEAIAEAHLREAVALCKLLGDEYGVVAGLVCLGDLARWRQDFGIAGATIEETATVAGTSLIWNGIDDSFSRGNLALDQHRYTDARRHLEEALTRAVTGGHLGRTPQILEGLAVAAQAGERDFQRAQSLLDQALIAAIAHGDRSSAVSATRALACLAAMKGETERALSLCRRAIGGWLEMGNIRGLADSLELFALLVSSEGDGLGSTRLLAACDAMRASHGCPRQHEVQRLIDTTCIRLRGQLSDGDFEAAWANGLTISPEDAVRCAVKRRRSNGHDRRGWLALTDTEREVAGLLIEGCTNAEIAERLMISPHTVNGNARRIFAKLGVKSRTDVVRLARGVPGGADGQDH